MGMVLGPESTQDLNETESGHVAGWSVVAPFLTAPDARWISDFVTDPSLSFTKVLQPGPQQSWHEKRSPKTDLSEWRRYCQVGSEALNSAESSGGGVVTVFPQLAAATGLQKRRRGMDVPIVSWFFNTDVSSGPSRMLAKWSLRAVDRFVVHSTDEIAHYAEELDFSPALFSYVPLQFGGQVQTHAEDNDDPFVFATGSGFRDYGTMFEAVEALGYPTKVLAGDRVLSGLTIPKNVTILEQMSKADIHRHVRQARVNVVPMNTHGVTAGLVTIVEAFAHDRGLVITERGGVNDYVRPGENSLGVAPGNASEMASAIEAMWTDEALRQRLGHCAGEFARTECSDEAAAAGLARILGEVSGTRVRTL